MAIEITLCIEDDGTMYVKSGEKEVAEVEDEGTKAPVKSIDEALQAIKQIAESAGVMSEPDPMAEQNEETAAMEQNFRPM